MTELTRILMRRDGLTLEEAVAAVDDARRMVREGADPEEVLHDEFGLEPDWVMDLI